MKNFIYEVYVNDRYVGKGYEDQRHTIALDYIKSNRDQFKNINPEDLQITFKLAEISNAT